MDTVMRALVLLLVIGSFVFVIFAWAKGWLKGSGARGSFTGQVIMHDWLNQDKQKAIEYVVDEQEEKEKKDASSGENKEPGSDKGEDEQEPELS